MKGLIKQPWLAALFVLLMSCFALSSCGDDDKDEPNGTNTSIVGTWSCSDRYYGGTDYFTFNQNGTYSWKCPGSWHDPHSGNYSFNNGLLKVIKSNGTSWIYLVQFSNSDSFILTDEDGDSYLYTRE